MLVMHKPYCGICAVSNFVENAVPVLEDVANVDGMETSGSVYLATLLNMRAVVIDLGGAHTL